MGRSTDEAGAARAVQIRRGQQAERGRLLKEIEQSQKRITALNEERAPIAAEVRKVEAEVGPIKYIAALVYGDNPDANLLEKAVRWVIILLVIVFDPLAIAMVLAATESLKWERQRVFEALNVVPEEAKDDPVPEPAPVDDPPADSWQERTDELLEIFKDQPTHLDPEPTTEIDDEQETPEIKEAMRRWKEANPGDTLKHQRALLEQGKIKELPWMQLIADNALPREPKSGFGTRFPDDPIKGDSFVRVDQLPTVLYKFNGKDWIQVDKSLTDNYTYDTAYIDHLIEKISSGELDIELLSDSEREQITQQLQTRTNQ
jgi:hypothetical protein